ncbi:MAG TPA: hypothetical protein VJB57_08160 [Dehalococcoidia bacterium]|nr:hypothetical protein [Dehalococcoidia bacterium]
MRLKKWGMAGLAVVAAGALAFGALSTVGVAQAQTPPGGGSGSSRSGRGLEMLAQQLGVSVDQLRNATQQVMTQLIDQAVASGRITKEQGDRLKAGPNRDRNNQQGQRNRDRDGMRGGFGGFGFSDIYGTLAGSLGITKDQLQSELRSGKSLAEIGAERGRTPEMLKNTLLTQIKADLQAQVTAGKINQRVADRMVAGLDRVLLRMINAKRGQFQPGQTGPRFGQPGQQGAPGGPR